MECQECKERPATVHFTKIINGEKTTIHLCEVCAQGKSEMSIFEQGSDLSFNHLLAGLLNFDSVKKSPTHASTTQERLHCKNCKLTFKQFMDTGNFGCPTCYDSFRPHLLPLLKRLHGGNLTHGGKVPTRVGGTIHMKKKIQELREILKQHIEKEEFEDAAVVRDQIRSLEQEIADEEGNV